MTDDYVTNIQEKSLHSVFLSTEKQVYFAHFQYNTTIVDNFFEPDYQCK